MSSLFREAEKKKFVWMNWTAIFSAQAALVVLAFFISTKVFTNLNSAPGWSESERAALVVVCGFQAAAILLMGAFKRSFRYAGIRDLLALAGTVSLSGAALSLLYLAGAKMSYRFVPTLTFLLLDAAMAFLCLSGFQFSLRVAQLVGIAANRKSRKVVIVGAGDGGASVARALLADAGAGAYPVAFVDDDVSKHGGQICGVPICDAIKALANVVKSTNATEILVCIPSADSSQMRRILGACRESGVPVRTLPSVSDLLNGQVSLADLRRVHIEDVLQRDTIALDKTLANNLISGKVVLVTGAGGSIGSELCRQVAAAGPAKLILIDKSENSLFYIQLALSETYPTLETKPCLVDVTNGAAVNEVFTTERPEVVFHAAAFKHVGMMELHPYEAVRNNLLGTRNVAEAAALWRVTHFVNISTDKAVNPSSYMGLSKQMAEQTIREMASRRRVRFMNVRFGNVAGSTGSVLRIFSDQIAKGGPLRVTDPRATRYFMSIPEAVYLILCAAALGKGGETFIFDMGDPINIYELARTMSLLSGYIPEVELAIEFIGLREGEKVHEELREDWEEMLPTPHPRLFTVAATFETRINMTSITRRLEELIEERNYAEMLNFIDQSFPRFAAGRMKTYQVMEYHGEARVHAAAGAV